MIVVEGFSLLLVLLVLAACIATYRASPETRKTKTDTEVLLRIVAPIAASLFFGFQLFSGYYSTGISMELECHAHGDTGEIRVTLSKGSGNFSKLVRLSALPRRAIAPASGEVVLPEIRFYSLNRRLDVFSKSDCGGPSSGAGQSPNQDQNAECDPKENLRLNPGDTIQFSQYFPTNGEPYIVNVLLEAKSAFIPRLESWKSSCFVRSRGPSHDSR